MSAVSARGARPEAFRPTTFFWRRVPEDREEIAAEAVRRRLHQAEAGVRRDRGVDGAPSLAQDLHSRLRAERLGARHHAVLGPDGGAGRLSTPFRGPFGEEGERDGEGEECDERRSHGGIVRGSGSKRPLVARSGDRSDRADNHRAREEPRAPREARRRSGLRRGPRGLARVDGLARPPRTGAGPGDAAAPRPRVPRLRRPLPRRRRRHPQAPVRPGQPRPLPVPDAARRPERGADHRRGHERDGPGGSGRLRRVGHRLLRGPRLDPRDDRRVLPGDAAREPGTGLLRRHRPVRRAARALPPKVVDGRRGRAAGRCLEDGDRHLRARGQPLHLRLLPLPGLGGAPGRREAARPGRARRGHHLHRPLHLPARHPGRRRRGPAPSGVGALVGLGPLSPGSHRRRDALPPLRGGPPHPAERLVRDRLRHPRRPPPRGRARAHGTRGARLARPAGDAHDGPGRRRPLPRLRPAAKAGAGRPRPEVPAGSVRPGAARDRRRRRPARRGRGPGGRRPPPPRGRPPAGPAGLLGLRARDAGGAGSPGHDRVARRRPRAGPDGGPPDVGPGRIAEHVPSAHGRRRRPALRRRRAREHAAGRGLRGRHAPLLGRRRAARAHRPRSQADRRGVRSGGAEDPRHGRRARRARPREGRADAAGGRGPPREGEGPRAPAGRGGRGALRVRALRTGGGGGRRRLPGRRARGEDDAGRPAPPRRALPSRPAARRGRDGDGLRGPRHPGQPRLSP